ncbi:protein obstructor-E [Panulirus ornatus]|uniref:protein obstructor-E n=1 Tax=Panulirus ornatus TaxID=150431 RepID=UPI003A8527AD
MYKLAILLLVGIAAAQYNCPENDGFYRDTQQCDKYYDCYRGVATEKMCADGLVFDTSKAPKVEFCDYPFMVDCPEGSILQPPNPSGIECPRQYGLFEHEDPSNCVDYYQCVEGEVNTLRCGSGLVFDEFTGTCQWEHTNIRSGCIARPVVLPDGFSCPNATQVHTNGQELDHPRYPKQDDCRSFYVCQDGKYPTLSGCSEGQVYNDQTLVCDAPENVPGCENYYGDSLSRTSGGGNF